ncbi:MAG: hypothetical protein AAFQ64_19185 [Pseudomonadota bacterium]
MQRLIVLWGALALIYIAFLGWHLPRSEPLTKAEVTALIAKLPESGGRDLSVAEGFVQFLSEDDGEPFFMLNLIEYRDEVAYAADVPDPAPSVAAANQAYGKAVVREQLKRGSYPAFMFEPRGLLLNSYDPAVGDFDHAVLARYRSRRDFLDMISSPAFDAAQRHKWASVERTLVVPVSPIAIITPGLVVPALLALLGLGITALYGWRRGAGVMTTTS